MWLLLSQLYQASWEEAGSFRRFGSDFVGFIGFKKLATTIVDVNISRKPIPGAELLLEQVKHLCGNERTALDQKQHQEAKAHWFRTSYAS